MRIRTRLKVLAFTSTALVVCMALLYYWSQQNLTKSIKANNLSDEIVASIFERSILRSDYLRNDNLRAKDQWLSKQSQTNELIKQAARTFDSDYGIKSIGSMIKNNQESAVVFLQIVANRDNFKTGLLHQEQASEIENRLVGQLLLKTYDTITDARSLQEASNALIVSTQKTAAIVSLIFIVTIALLMIIIALSLIRIIRKGIENLQLGTLSIGAGNLHHMIPLIGGEELANVAEAFNKMSGKLTESYSALEQEITERKLATDKVEQLNRELNNTVSQLQGANQELEAFAYTVSHDLRAPLRAMGGFSEALVEDYGDKLEGDARAYLDEVVSGSRHMGQLIDGLLTLSRCTRGEMRCEALDLSDMSNRIRCELEHLDPQNRVEWRIEPGLSASGDGRMIEVVMRNLLSNAWKYCSGKLDSEIRFYAEKEGEISFFCVSDNGAGFDMAHSEKLFQPFQRLHRQEEFPGMGIGLATAQRIVHRHGGTIQAMGEPRKGATFRFSLPYGETQ